MEDKRVEARKKFFKFKFDQPKQKREQFLVNLRKKRKLEIIKNNR